MKNKLKLEDQALFRRAMQGVRPLKRGQEKRRPEPPPVKVRPMLAVETLPASDPFSDHEYLDLVGSEDPIEFARAGISAKLFRRLRQGDKACEATLDLHGKTVEEARLHLHRFLLACGAQGIKRALVIHGKGRGKAPPVLKNKLNHWLRQSEQVLAFCSARKEEGGRGAVYLYLKTIKLGAVDSSLIRVKKR